MRKVWRRTFSELLSARRRERLINSDGLHLTAEGYEPVFNALTKQVLEKWPEMNPETMDMPTPQCVSLVDAADDSWALVDPQNPRGILGPRSSTRDEL